MAYRIVTVVLGIFLINHADSANLAYTKESDTVSGNTCMTDCGDDGLCWTQSRKQEPCVSGRFRAAIYYTSRYKYPAISTCRSRCVFGGYDYSWCYVDDEFNWDYCSTDTDGITKWYQYTAANGRCLDECSYRDNTSYLWCHTFWDTWDYCSETYYYEEEARTIYGKTCYGNCLTHEGAHYYWCYDETRTKSTCAPTAVRYGCLTSRNCRSDNCAPRKTVAEYNQDIDNDPTLITVILGTFNNPNMSHPVLNYTYRVTDDHLRLPVRVRARILPQHLQGRNTRTSGAVSSAARRYCDAMGMNRQTSNGNNDQCGHMIPYILGGPSAWFNIVPQTQRINIGTTHDTDINARSIWRDAERVKHHWAQQGGSIHFQVFITYNLTSSTRPTGFGTIETHYAPNGTQAFECPGYWFSNDPHEDPDMWNE